MDLDKTIRGELRSWNNAVNLYLYGGYGSKGGTSRANDEKQLQKLKTKQKWRSGNEKKNYLKLKQQFRLVEKTPQKA